MRTLRASVRPCAQLPGLNALAAFVLCPPRGSLNELRISCAVAEQERDGGISARVSPLAHGASSTHNLPQFWSSLNLLQFLLLTLLKQHARAVRDAGNLLTRAGFALPAVDTDTITLYYPSGELLPTHFSYLT